ncbi:YbaB/EbfC family nucleoid-associated protein [Amycolatopsis sp. NPDC059021]|uniref:YbaB/EbfC family nucleoid-associated protein n=1 Tax=Amycolatopsis sp. NPDC059021 TaxID=3346704 RepID=UPI00366B3A99
MADLSDVERMVDDWERDAVGKSQRFQAMQEQVEQISLTGTVAGGAISVTVGHNGLPTAIKMTDGVRSMSPDEIAANVMKAIQKAQSQYPQKMREILAETVGDDDAARHIAETAERNFPDAPEEDPEPSLPEEPRRRLYETDEEPPPPAAPRTPPPAPKPPAAPRRPAPPDDDEDFGDQSFLRRD